MQTTPLDAVAESRRAVDRTGPDDLRYGLRISVWVRWFLLIAWLLQFNYRPNFADPAYIPTTLLAVSLLAFNGYVHYRIRSNRTVTRRWALALSTMDVLTATAGIVVSASGFQNTFFVLYYPALAMFAVVFTSFRLSFAWVTMVAVVYAVVAAVNLVSRFERIRRREAVERERELQRERIELSQTIHDTIAQAAYMIGLGLETPIELADARNDENRDELAGSDARPVEIDDVGAEASHRRGTHIRWQRAWPRAAVARLHLHRHHVDPHRAGPVRQGAASPPDNARTAVFDSSQRDDECIPPLGYVNRCVNSQAVYLFSR